VYTRIDSQFLSGHIQFLSTPSKRAEVESPVELLLLALGGNGGERAQRRGRCIPVGRNGEKIKRTEGAIV
jgi:hypothetical protein